MDFTVEVGVRILRPKGDVMTNFGPRAEMSTAPAFNQASEIFAKAVFAPFHAVGSLLF